MLTFLKFNADDDEEEKIDEEGRIELELIYFQ